MDEAMKTMKNNKWRKQWKIHAENNKGKEIIRYDQESSSCNSNKNNNFFSWPGPPRLLNLIKQMMLPWEMKRKIEEDLNGYEIKLVIEKKISIRDVRFHGFAIPEDEILIESRDFLRPHEVENLKKTSSSSSSSTSSISVLLLDQNLELVNDLTLSWRITDNWIASASYYNLTYRWIDVLFRNELKLDDVVQLWSFRRDNDELGFALVKLN